MPSYEISVNVDNPLVVIKFSRDSKAKFVLCIEDNVKDSSIEDLQTQMKLDGVEKQFVEEKTKILFCFLTLKPSRKSAECFEKIQRKYPSSIHLFWIPSEHKYKSIYEKLQQILILSNEGSIDPITSEVRYLLTSFLNFIKKGFKGENFNKKRLNRFCHIRTVTQTVRVRFQSNLRQGILHLNFRFPIHDW